MTRAKTDTGVSWVVAFDFDCEPNSLSPLLSGGNILWTTQVTLDNMATAKTDTGVSRVVAFDFDCEPNSLSPLLSGGNKLWTMHDENTNLDNSCTILFGSPFIDKDRCFVWLLVVELSALWEQYGFGSQTTSVLLLFYEYVAEGWV